MHISNYILSDKRNATPFFRLLCLKNTEIWYLKLNFRCLYIMFKALTSFDKSVNQQQVTGFIA